MDNRGGIVDLKSPEMSYRAHIFEKPPIVGGLQRQQQQQQKPIVPEHMTGISAGTSSFYEGREAILDVQMAATPVRLRSPPLHMRKQASP